MSLYKCVEFSDMEHLTDNLQYRIGMGKLPLLYVALMHIKYRQMFKEALKHIYKNIFWYP